MAPIVMENIAMPIAGGVLIGLSASMLLLFNGRVAGISGILGALVVRETSDKAWRAAFVAGLLGGGAVMLALLPSAFGEPSAASSNLAVAIPAGLLVGFGTMLGSGCTSGHGVCGIGRGSTRSIAATLTFMATGMIAVIALRTLSGGAL